MHLCFFYGWCSVLPRVASCPLGNHHHRRCSTAESFFSSREIHCLLTLPWILFYQVLIYLMFSKPLTAFSPVKTMEQGKRVGVHQRQQRQSFNTHSLAIYDFYKYTNIKEYRGRTASKNTIQRHLFIAYHGIVGYGPRLGIWN